MAKELLTWDEIAQKDEFKALDKAEREKLRNTYFSRAIASRTPTEQLDDARKRFDKDTKPTILKSIKGAVGDVVEKLTPEPNDEQPIAPAPAGTRATAQPRPQPQSPPASTTPSIVQRGLGWAADTGKDAYDMAAMSVGGAIPKIPAATEQVGRGMLRQGMMAAPAMMAAAGGMGHPAAAQAQLDAQRATTPQAVDETMTALPKIQTFEDWSAYGDQVRKDIETQLSPKLKKALDDSKVSGNLFKGEIDFGKDPSVYGYSMQAVSVLGSMVPTLATLFVTRSPAAAASVGGGMAASEGMDAAREFIKQKSDAELYQESPGFKVLVDKGMPVEQARAIITDKATEASATLQGMVGALGDVATSKLLMGHFDNVISGLAKGKAGRIGVGAAGAGVEGAVTEVAEGVGSDVGIAGQVPTKEIGEDSAENAVLGALGGAAIGAAGGAMAGSPKDVLAQDMLRQSEQGAPMDPAAADLAARQAMDPNLASGAVAPPGGIPPGAMPARPQIVPERGPISRAANSGAAAAAAGINPMAIEEDDDGTGLAGPKKRPIGIQGIEIPKPMDPGKGPAVRPKIPQAPPQAPKTGGIPGDISQTLNRYSSQAGAKFRTGLDEGAFADLAHRVMWQESRGKTGAVSPKGAKGLMQLMPGTAANPGFGIEGTRDNSPEENMRVGTEYLAAMLNRYDGDVSLALIAYNAGPGTADDVRSGKRQTLPKETQGYLKTIMGGKSLPRAATSAAQTTQETDAQGQRTRVETTPTQPDGDPTATPAAAVATQADAVSEQAAKAENYPDVEGLDPAVVRGFVEAYRDPATRSPEPQSYLRGRLGKEVAAAVPPESVKRLLEIVKGEEPAPAPAAPPAASGIKATPATTPAETTPLGLPSVLKPESATPVKAPKPKTTMAAGETKASPAAGTLTSGVEPRELTTEGRAKDGKPILPGNTFKTSSGRVTTPYPKQKGEKYASQWLIDNAAAEAESRGDDFNAPMFRAAKPGRDGELTTSDRESMQEYLFGEQPPVVDSILKDPTTGRPMNRPAQEQQQAARKLTEQPSGASGRLDPVAVGEGVNLPEQKGRYKYRVASVQPEQRGGYVRLERATKNGDTWAAVKGDDGSSQLSREYVLKTFGVRAVHRDDDLRGTGIGDEVRQQRDNDALATRQQQVKDAAASDNLSDRAKMALNDLMTGRPETVRKDVARGNLTVQEAIALVDRLEAGNAFAGGAAAAERARQQIEFGRADAVSNAAPSDAPAATPPVAGQPAGAGRGGAADGGGARKPKTAPALTPAQQRTSGRLSVDDAGTRRPLKQGDTIRLSGEMGYASSGKDYTVDEIDKGGHVRLSSATGRTSISPAELEGAIGRGVTVELVRGDAESAPTEQSLPKPKPPATGAEVTQPQFDAVYAAVRAVTTDLRNADDVIQRIATALGFESYTKDTHEGKVIEEVAEAAFMKLYREIAQSPRAPQDVQSLINAIYAKQPRMVTRTGTSSANQAYSTPVPLSYASMRMLGATKRPGVVMDATAGTASLLITADPKTAIVNELNPERANLLRLAGFENVTEHNALQWKTEEDVDIVATNPPFGTQSGKATLPDGSTFGTTRLEYAIVMRQMEALKPDGRAVIIVGGPNPKLLEPGAERTKHYATTNARNFNRDLRRWFNVIEHVTVSGDLYRAQGAAWPVDVYIVSGRRDGTAIPEHTLPNNAAYLPQVITSWEKLDALVQPVAERVDRERNRAGEIPAAPDADADQHAGAGGKAGGRPGRSGARSGRRPVREGGSVDASGQSEGTAGSGADGRPSGELAGDGGRASAAGDGNTGSRTDTVGPGRDGVTDDQRLDTAIDDELGALFGEAPAKAAAKATRAPRSARAPSAVKPAQRTAASAAVSAATNAKQGLADVADGLNALFGTPGKLGSGLSFDEASYAKAKPLFIAGIKHFYQAGQDIAEMAKLLVRALVKEHGLQREAVENMRPYLKRFILDVRDGKIDLAEAPKAKPDVIRKDRTAEAPKGQAHYPSRSQGSEIGTFVPEAHAAGIDAALSRLESQVGDIDSYVMGKLGYANLDELYGSLAAEQIDALALAIDNLDNEMGFVIADQTGVGKGRFVASMIKYARSQGIVPVFVTEKPNLYVDMIRDLNDIGVTDLKPLLTNTNIYGKDALRLEGGGTLTRPAGNHARTLESAAEDWENSGFDAVFTTYDQMNSSKGQMTPRHLLLQALAPNAMLILDESHNAGGTGVTQEQIEKDAERGKTRMPREVFFRELLGNARGAVFSSATWAKRPQSMTLYAANTDLGDLPGENLERFFQRGGVPLQQAVSSLMAESGQLMRREKSFEGIEFDTATTHEVERADTDAAAEALAIIRDFDTDFAQPIIKALAARGANSDARYSSTGFASIMHNLIDQAFTSLKADQLATQAIEILDRGEKLVIGMSNTNETALDELMTREGLVVGSKVEFTLRDLYRRFLRNTLSYTKKESSDPNDRGERIWIDPSKLSAGAQAAYERALSAIENIPDDAPGSPLDHIRMRLSQAGYRIGEITGREVGVDYATGTIYKRPDDETSITGRRQALTRFNGGMADKPLPKEQRLDVLLINQSGATGASMHASEKFADQSQRAMLLGQYEKNIDTFMQMLGRINRTGQVVLPKYYFPKSNIPAETRLHAVLAKKLTSLNANVTGAGKSSVSIDVPEFMDEYGGLAAMEVLSNNEDMAKRMEIPSTTDPVEFVQKITGRVGLLSMDKQEQFYDQLFSSYAQLTEQAKAMGLNVGAMSVLPLEAKPIRRRVAVPATSERPLGKAVYAYEIDAKLLSKPATIDGIKAEAAEFMKDERRPENFVTSAFYDTSAQYEKFQSAEDKKERNITRFTIERSKDAYEAKRKEDASLPPWSEASEKALIEKSEAQIEERRAKEDKAADVLLERMRMMRPLATLQVKIRRNKRRVHGVVARIERTGRAKNPRQLNQWTATVYLATHEPRMVTLKLSQMGDGDKADFEIEPAEASTVVEAFDRAHEAVKSGRQQRVMLTGNAPVAFAQFEGQITQYTDATGKVGDGILLPADVSSLDDVARKALELKSGKDILGYLTKLAARRGDTPVDRDDVALSLDDQALLSLQDGKVRVRVLSSQGAARFRKKSIVELLKATGRDFIRRDAFVPPPYGRGTWLKVWDVDLPMTGIDADGATTQVLDQLVKIARDPLFAPSEHLDLAAEVMGIKTMPDIETLDSERSMVESARDQGEVRFSRSQGEYPRAGAEVDGRAVIKADAVPNMDSIDSTLDDYTVLDGLREVPVSAFESLAPRDMFYASDDIRRVEALAERIKASGEISPLIVVVDAEGPYILEGAHRAAALHLLGAKSFPAVVVTDDSAESIQFSRTETTNPANLTPSDIRASIAPMVASWKTAVKVEVLPSVTDPATPEAVRTAHAKLGENDVVDGVYYRGTVYLFSDAIQSEAHAAEVLMHEALGHLGLRGAFGPALTGVLDNLIAARRSDVIAKARAYGLDPKDRNQLRQAAEEVLAEMAQTRPELGFVKRAVAAIRQWLRENIPAFRDLMLTDAEIIARYIVPARAFVERGGRGKVTGASPRFMFAGRGAKTADAHTLTDAQARLAAGENAETVRQETGWHVGADEKWRFEIDDSGAKIKPNAPIQPGRDGQQAHWLLGDILDHPRLFAAYPTLANIKVVTRDRRGASYSHGARTITVQAQGAWSASDARLSGLLHEIQHGIQNIEGFADGASPENVPITKAGLKKVIAEATNTGRTKVLKGARKLLDKIREAESRLGTDIDKAQSGIEALLKKQEELVARYSEISDTLQTFRGKYDAQSLAEESKVMDIARQVRDERAAVLRDLNHLMGIMAKSEGAAGYMRSRADKDVLFELYNQIAGEVEARNTQARQNMTAAERRATSPEETADVAANNVIVTFNGKEAMSAPMPENATDPDIRFSRRTPPPADPLLEEARRKSGRPARESYGMRMRRVLSQSFITSKAEREAAIDAGRQGMLDQFHGIKRAEQRNLGNLPVEQSAYVTARLANGISSVMRAVLLHGAPQWAANKQHLVKKPGTQGLLDILAPVADDLDSWLDWMIGNRAKRLMGEGRENLFTEEEINRLIASGDGKEAQFRAVSREFAAFKRAILDVAEDAGLIDPESRATWDHADWIPFYRQMEATGQTLAPRSQKALANQSSGIRQLKGGTSALNDPIENIILNFHHLLDASLKNNAVRKSVKAAGDGVVERVGMEFKKRPVPRNEIRRELIAQGMPKDIVATFPSEVFDGISRMWSMQPPTDKDVIRVMEGGKPAYYRVLDPLLLKAVTSYEAYAWADVPGMAAARAAKRILTQAVTATPEFMLRNFIRDTASTAIISKSPVAAAGAIKGIVKAYRESGGAEHMLFAGASFASGYIEGGDTEAVARSVRRSLRRRGMSASSADAFMASVIDTPAKFWEQYRRAGEAIENANREAVFEAVIKRGGSVTEAAYEAKDLMDFSLRGGWAGYNLLADVIPFFNARVQGLYRLGRTDPKALAVRSAIMLTLPTLLLAFANLDNDEYEELADWDKDTYWHLFPGGEHFRIPKPFEVGLIFGTIPERAFHALAGDDEGKKFVQRATWGLVETFNLGFMPQLVGPLYEVATNRDAFRGTDIESMGDKNLLPHLRHSGRTSQTLRELLSVTAPVTDPLGLSPKRAQHLIEGYLGTMGSWGLGIVDSGTRLAIDEPDRPAMRPDDMPLLRVLYRGPQDIAPRSTQFINDVYDAAREYSQIDRSIKDLRKDGKDEAALRLEERFRERLDLNRAMEKAAETLTKQSKEIDAVYQDRRLTPEQKRADIDRLYRDRADIAREEVERRREMKAGRGGWGG